MKRLLRKLPLCFMPKSHMREGMSVVVTNEDDKNAWIVRMHEIKPDKFWVCIDGFWHQTNADNTVGRPKLKLEWERLHGTF